MLQPFFPRGKGKQEINRSSQQRKKCYLKQEEVLGRKNKILETNPMIGLNNKMQTDVEARVSEPMLTSLKNKEKNFFFIFF